MSAIHAKSSIAGATALFALSGLTLLTPSASGQRGLGDPRKIYPGAEVLLRHSNTRGGHVVRGGGYYSAPYYVPSYYGSYYAPGFNGGGFAVGLNYGGVSLGYSQVNSYPVYPAYQAYQPVPPPVVNNYNYNYAPPSRPNDYLPGEPRSLPRNQPQSLPSTQPSIQPRNDDSQYDTLPPTQAQTPRPLKTGEDEPNDYYLNRKTAPAQKDTSLAVAVHDIEMAFRNGDIRLIQKHLQTDGMLTLMSMGRTRRQLSVADFLEMTKDAFANVKTISYKLDNIEPASGGAFLAYGKHVLKGDNGEEKVFNVSYVLKKIPDENGAANWRLTEVSADPAK
jgi:hypothetical protein